jgi:hypothetical protein
MRFRRAGVTTALACALACGLTGALAGCVADTPTAITTPTPTVAPLFATEEEALAAATEAYAAYLKVSDAISADGGANPERIAAVVTPEWLPKELAAFTKLGDLGVVQVGATKFANMSLQSFDTTGSQAMLSIYVCSDVSGTRIRDAAGVDVTPSGRLSRFPLLVSFVSRSDKSTLLLLDGSETWDGDDFCN